MRIVGPGCHQGNVISKRHHLEPFRGTIYGAFTQIACQVRCQRGTPSVSKNKNRVLFLISLEHDLGNVIYLLKWKISYAPREEIKVRLAIACFVHD